jgi:hypothetical protein
LAALGVFSMLTGVMPGVGLLIQRHRPGVIGSRPWCEQKQQPGVCSCVYGMALVRRELE